MMTMTINEQEREALIAILYYELDQDRSATHKTIISGLLKKLEDYE